jgi:hypothetical protein
MKDDVEEGRKRRRKRKDMDLYSGKMLQAAVRIGDISNGNMGKRETGEDTTIGRGKLDGRREIDGS